MADIKSNKKFKFDSFTGYDYIECFLKWSYATCADVLTLTKISPKDMSVVGEDSCKIELDEAKATLLTLLDWDDRFNHGSILKEHLESKK